LGDLGQTAFGDFLQSIGDGAHHHVAIQPRGSALKSRADPKDLADALAFALRYSGRTRVRDAAEMMARDRRQAPRRALGTIGVCGHEEAARGRGCCARPWFRRAVMFAGVVAADKQRGWPTPSLVRDQGIEGRYYTWRSQHDESVLSSFEFGGES
jgi:hypothetical protein